MKSVTTSFGGSTVTSACGLRAVVLVRSEPHGPLLAGDGDLVVEPAKLQLLPRAEVGAAGADADIVPADSRLCAMIDHQPIWSRPDAVS